MRQNRKNFHKLAKNINRKELNEHVARRYKITKYLNNFLGHHYLLCFPTTPFLAPRKKSVINHDRHKNNYFLHTLTMTEISGLVKCLQVTIPGGSVNGIPIGLSFLAGSGNDKLLIDVARDIKNLLDN